MNKKATYKYFIEEHKKAIIIFYLILVGVMLLMYIGMGLSTLQEDGGAVSGQIGGFELSTAIFLLVTGLCGFKESFGMLLQNGVSRKTLFTTRVTFTVMLAFIMTCIDKFIFLIFEGFNNLFEEINITTFYEQIYYAKAKDMSIVNIHINSYIFNFFMYLCVISIGYFFAVLFYRINKLGKILIGAGIPVTLFTILPILDQVFFHGKISSFLVKFIDFAFGFSSFEPLRGMVSFYFLFIGSSIFSWILMRKTIVKQ